MEANRLSNLGIPRAVFNQKPRVRGVWSTSNSFELARGYGGMLSYATVDRIMIIRLLTCQFIT